MLQETALAEDADPAALGAQLAPRLQAFLAELDGHHRIEDGHYFPALRAAQPELAKGFDLLAADHEHIHESLLALVAAARGFLASVGPEASGSAEDQRAALAHCAAATGQLERRLVRHFEDEEDLIIPVLLVAGN